MVSAEQLSMQRSTKGSDHLTKGSRINLSGVLVVAMYLLTASCISQPKQPPEQCLLLRRTEPWEVTKRELECYGFQSAC